MKTYEAMPNKKIIQSEKIQSPYSWATIIRTIPLRFRFPNSLPPQKDDIWGSGGGESPTKLKIGILSSALQHTGWVRLVHYYIRTKILTNRWYQIGAKPNKVKQDTTNERWKCKNKQWTQRWKTLKSTHSGQIRKVSKTSTKNPWPMQETGSDKVSVKKLHRTPR